MQSKYFISSVVLNNTNIHAVVWNSSVLEKKKIRKKSYFHEHFPRLLFRSMGVHKDTNTFANLCSIDLTGSHLLISFIEYDILQFDILCLF